MNKIIITNAHAHGFAFACDMETQGQVFIPVHIAEGFDLAPGDEIEAVQTLNNEALDAEMLTYILAGGYHITAELADYFELDHKTAGNAAQRLFNSGKIAKADVFNRVGQQRPTTILWAASAKTFIEVT